MMVNFRSTIDTDPRKPIFQTPVISVFKIFFQIAFFVTLSYFGCDDHIQKNAPVITELISSQDTVLINSIDTILCSVKDDNNSLQFNW
jgi:hypothetical protein